MARFNVALEKGFSAHDVEQKDSSKLKRLGAKAVAVVGVGTMAVFGMGVANAEETNIYVGGNADPTSQLPVDAAIQQGRFDPNDNNIQIHYPASMWPLGPVRTDASIAEGSQKAYDAYNANRFDEKVRMDCFSLGAAVCNVVADRIAAEHGGQLPGNVEIVRNGDGWGATGITNHPLATTFRPVLKPIMEDMVGIPLDLPQTPGTINRFDINDVWGNGGAQGMDIGALITMLSTIPQNHRIPDPREPHVTFVDKFGVINEIYGGDRDAITKAIEAAGFVVPPIGEAFFNIVAGPNNPIEDPNFNPAKHNPVRNVPQVTPEQYVEQRRVEPVKPAPVALPTPQAIVVPPPPTPGVPMTPEQLAFANQLSTAVSGIK